MNTYNKQLGTQGEELVCRHLKEKGYRIEETNYSSRYGEIDIIALDEGELCFIEVKTRNDEAYGDPLESVTPQKQQRLIKMAQWYLFEKDLDDVSARFDVVAVLGNPEDESRIEIIKNAFELGENK